VAGPGSDFSEASMPGFESTALESVVAPECPPGPVFSVAVALLAGLGLEAALHQAAGDDDAGTLGEALDEVLGGLPPDDAAQKQRVAVAPLPVGLQKWVLGLWPAPMGSRWLRDDRRPCPFGCCI